jgi:hypothetical protein
MKRKLVSLALLATLTVIGWDARAGEDGGMDATVDSSADAPPPPKDSSPKDSSKDTSTTPDGTIPPDAETDSPVTPPVEGGAVGDVIVADGGEFSDVPVPPPDASPLSSDGGVNETTTSSGGGCSIASGVEDRVLAGVGFVLGTLALGVSRSRRRRPH